MYNLVHRAMIQWENKQRTKQNLDFLSLGKTQINDFFCACQNCFCYYIVLYFVVLPMHLLTVFLLPSFFVKLVQFTLSIHAFHHAFTFHHVGINFMVITWRCKEYFQGFLTTCNLLRVDCQIVIILSLQFLTAVRSFHRKTYLGTCSLEHVIDPITFLRHIFSQYHRLLTRQRRITVPTTSTQHIVCPLPANSLPLVNQLYARFQPRLDQEGNFHIITFTIILNQTAYQNKPDHQQ